MVETAAHLADHVLPRLPMRQWVLSVPKRPRYFMQRDGVVLNMVLRIFLRVVKQSLQVHCPGAAWADIGADRVVIVHAHQLTLLRVKLVQAGVGHAQQIFFLHA